MADKVVMVSSEAQERQQLAAEMAELAKNPPSRTIPGGRYRVGGVLVDANGKPLKGAAAKAAEPEETEDKSSSSAAGKNARGRK